MTVTSQPFGEAWLAEYFQMADRLDPEELVTWYTPDAVFRSGNLPEVTGHAAIIAALTAFYAAISTMRHEKTGSWADHDSGVFEAIAHVRTKDGRVLALPAMTSLRLRDHKVNRLLFVMDATPISQPATGGAA